jgi:hypothetical protein
MKLLKRVQAVKKDNIIIPKTDNETGYYTFVSDGEFKILQLTDVHIGGGFLSRKKDALATEAIANLTRYTKPDLIIVTGDMVYPILFQSGTIDNLRATRYFAEIMERLGVYWTISFGNHDAERMSLGSKAELSEIYSDKNLKYCLYKRGPENIDGYGNQIIAIQNSCGIITQAVFIFDSQSYAGWGLRNYDNIHKNQMEWYESEIIRLNAINRGRGAEELLKSLAFFHIPLKEQKNAWQEYSENGKKDTLNVKYRFGVAAEKKGNVYFGEGGADVFKIMLKTGSTHGIFTGHDHLNNFSVDYNGGFGDRYIRITAGMSIDYLAYPGIQKKHSQRGGTVITVKNDGGFDVFGLRLIDYGVLE